MNTDATLQEGKKVRNLGKLAVVWGQVLDRVVEDTRHHVLFVRGVLFGLVQGQGEGLAFSLAEREDDDGVVVLQHDHLDDLLDVGLPYGRFHL